ncbi:MAG: hypothetical protein WCT35_07355 [Sideroxydans sp.]|jgi:hypothetical protein
MTIDLRQHSTKQLFELYVAALKELKERGVTRSTNNPIADYAELLFMGALDLTLKAKSTKGHDATDTDGRKYEIKGRRVTAHNTSRQLSSLRDLDSKHFDFLGGVLFNEDFSVYKACLIPHDQVLQNATYNAHTNGSIFHLRDSVWLLPGVVDVTAKLQQAEKAHG